MIFKGVLCYKSFINLIKGVEMAGRNTSNQGFAGMDKDKQREIASQGGQASGGNFKNDPERASEAGKKGGQASSRS